MAPEMLAGNGYTQKADIWSLGITIIELAEGRPPHWNLEPEEAYDAIVNGDSPQLSEPSRWSKEFQHFLALCLRKDPRSRPNVQRLRQHPFMDASSGTSESLWQAFVADAQRMKESSDVENSNSARQAAIEVLKAPWSMGALKISSSVTVKSGVIDYAWMNDYSSRFLSGVPIEQATKESDIEEEDLLTDEAWHQLVSELNKIQKEKEVKVLVESP
eukprot:TRINITY_DN13888_c0_g1_i1.p1 TRINITY_DN13888_c0_g1~~TRINITY_DN13888_c0_g1_i1.p1  ORF type:complete len:241 (+),score=49.49 TRINITY_DN13888_c0_g1_i1:78-725(+)